MVPPTSDMKVRVAEMESPLSDGGAMGTDALVPELEQEIPKMDTPLTSPLLPTVQNKHQILLASTSWDVSVPPQKRTGPTAGSQM